MYFLHHSPTQKTHAEKVARREGNISNGFVAPEIPDKKNAERGQRPAFTALGLLYLNRANKK